MFKLGWSVFSFFFSFLRVSPVIGTLGFHSFSPCSRSFSPLVICSFCHSFNIFAPLAQVLFTRRSCCSYVLYPPPFCRLSCPSNPSFPPCFATVVRPPGRTPVPFVPSYGWMEHIFFPPILFPETCFSFFLFRDTLFQLFTSLNHERPLPTGPIPFLRF